MELQIAFPGFRMKDRSFPREIFLHPAKFLQGSAIIICMNTQAISNWGANGSPTASKREKAEPE